MEDRIGLDEVYCPKPPNEPVVQIVFVHGLFGHRRKTWTGHGKTSGESGQTSENPATLRNKK